jgi:hypothetical protein
MILSSRFHSTLPPLRHATDEKVTSAKISILYYVAKWIRCHATNLPNSWNRDPITQKLDSTLHSPGFPHRALIMWMDG